MWTLADARFIRPWPAALAAALAIALLMPAGAGAAKKKKKKDQGGLSGVVTDQEGKVLAGIAVAVSSPEFSAEDTTDKKGEFAIDVPDAGEYVLRLAGEGYTPFETAINLATGEKQSLTVKLLDAEAGRRNEAVKAYNEGARAFEAGDLVVARQHFLAATEADPSLPEPYLVLADIYLTEEAPEEAAAAAEKFLALKPGDRKGQALAYEAYQKLGNQAKVDELRATLGGTDLAPQLAVQTYNEGAVADQKGDSETAIAKFRAALELDPDLAEAHAGLATVYFNREQYDDSLAAIDKLLALKPDNAQAYRIRFLIHDVRGQDAAAAEAMESYTKLDPDGAANLLYRAADRDFRGGERARAQAALEKVLALDPDFARAHYTLGLIYASSDTAKARVHLEKFIELAPDDPEVASAKEMMSYF